MVGSISHCWQTALLKGMSKELNPTSIWRWSFPNHIVWLLNAKAVDILIPSNLPNISKFSDRKNLLFSFAAVLVLGLTSVTTDPSHWLTSCHFTTGISDWQCRYRVRFPPLWFVISDLHAALLIYPHFRCSLTFYKWGNFNSPKTSQLNTWDIQSCIDMKGMCIFTHIMPMFESPLYKKLTAFCSNPSCFFPAGISWIMCAVSPFPQVASHWSYQTSYSVIGMYTFTFWYWLEFCSLLW